ncbi:MAG: glycosyltransferase family 87 protein [Myxococcaceae bacterium]
MSPPNESARRWPQAVGLAAFCALAVLHALFLKPYASDFAVVHLAAERALRGENLYVLSELNPFKYAPASALLFAPLGLLPPLAAHAVWALLSALATWRFLSWTVRRLGAGSPGWLKALPVVLVTPYVLHHFALGQCDAVLLALLTFSEDDAERHPLRSGLLLAAAALVKLPVLVLLAPALFFRQWRRLAALALGLGGATALAALRFAGLDQLAAWRSLLAATTPPMLCSAQNQSAWALACTYFAPPSSPLFLPAVAALGLAAAGLLAAATVRALRADPARGRLIAFAGALYLSAFLSPLGWWTNFMALAPLVAVLAATARESPLRAARWAGVCSLSALAVAGAINFDTVGRERFEVFLLWRHFALAALFAAVVFALTSSSAARGSSPALPPTPCR